MLCLGVFESASERSRMKTLCIECLLDSSLLFKSPHSQIEEGCAIINRVSRTLDLLLQNATSHVNLAHDVAASSLGTLEAREAGVEGLDAK